MTERPYIWHAGRFGGNYKGGYPWTVTLGRPKHPDDWVEVAKTPAEAMEKALKLVPKEVP